MRCLYSALFYLALPFIALRLAWRSLREPAYRQRVPERFGYCPFKLDESLWVHAVSVGEVIASIPLIKLLKQNYPALPIVMTTMTPTGAAQVKNSLGDTVIHAYLPYDLPAAVKRFLTAAKPRMGIIMETELWPNLLAECQKQAVPVCLLNARLSEKSAKAYQRIAGLMREMLQSMSVIAAQGQQDADRFLALGALKERVVVTGNIKFDLELPPELASGSKALRSQLGDHRFIWIAASTHEGEEEIILAAHQLLREVDPHALLILVPRHSARFDAVAKLSAQSFKTIRRSQEEACTLDAAVYVGDTMGELLLLYGASDAAFIGGSFIPHGGHNMLEPGALGKPLLTGPSLFNFAEVSELFFAARALIKVQDASSLAKQLVRLMQDPDERKQMGEKALQVVEANRGALAKQADLISKVSRLFKL